MPSFSAPPIRNNEMYSVSKTIAFDGTAGNGAVGSVSVFTVTGHVLVTAFAVCTEDLASSGGTISLGTAINSQGVIATTTATTIDNGLTWVDTGPASIDPIPTTRLIASGADLIATVATAAITDGTLIFYCLWRPLSTDGLVTGS